MSGQRDVVMGWARQEAWRGGEREIPEQWRVHMQEHGAMRRRVEARYGDSSFTDR